MKGTPKSIGTACLAVCLAMAVALGPAGCTINIGGSSVGTIKGSGAAVDEGRTVSGIESVQVTNQGDLTIEMGDTPSLVVHAQKELLPYIETKVEGSTLVIRTKAGHDLDPTEPIEYRPTVPTIGGLTTTSSGSIHAARLSGDAVAIRVTSSGTVTIENLEATRLTVEDSSSGDVSAAAGRVEEQNIRLNSSGNYGAKDLVSARATVRLSSSGDAYVQASDSLDAQLSSSGNVYLSGTATVKAKTSSSGKVITSP